MYGTPLCTSPRQASSLDVVRDGVGLFWTELNFITKVVPNSYTSSSQASV